MWNASAQNAYPQIFLHDCRVCGMQMDGDDLIFRFDENGFWISEQDPRNPYGMTLRTDASIIRLTNCDFAYMSFYLFREVRLFGHLLFTKRVSVSFAKLGKLLRRGKCSMEFVSELYATHTAEFHGYLHGIAKRPVEWQLHAFYEDMVYAWNEICPEKPL